MLPLGFFVGPLRESAEILFSRIIVFYSERNTTELSPIHVFVARGHECAICTQEENLKSFLYY